MKVNKSKRHHYIPKFLTKNFTDDEGLLYVYNKIENKIINTRQSPKAIFFEMDRNTVTFGEHVMDNLEQIYSELDSKIAIDLKKVLETNKVTPEELTSITLLATQLKWRIPKIDNDFNKIKEDLTQEQLRIRINVTNENIKLNNEAIEHIEKAEIFKESKRILLSILPLLNEHKLLEIHNNSFIQKNILFPSLIGDCPVIERRNSDFSEIEDFIFPLSSSDTFIYKKETNKCINNFMFFIQRDLAIINSSTQYVGCKSKHHLEKIIEIYNEIKSENKLDNINKFLFDFID